MSTIKAYIDNNKQKFLDELIELLKIPSVSADPKFKEDVRKAAEYLKSKFEELGVETTIHETKGHPIVYAEKIISDSRPTILVYGHYDVQPADPYELWESPPFEPVVKNERVYARGACDDKGQLYMHIKAHEVLSKTDNLDCNVKFLIEGEEEVGSDNLELFLRENKAMLQADTIVISDTSLLDNDIPSITIGLRGLSYLEVEVVGPNRDLHSGVYGGAVANPINILTQMIASLHDENGKINIPGFYDAVVELSDEQRKELEKTPFDLVSYQQHLNIKDVYGEKGYTTIERTGIRPSLDVNGIWGGYSGRGAKTVLPSKANAKISMRLVPNQDTDTISKLLADHLKKIAPKSVKVNVSVLHGGNPIVIATENKGYQAAAKAMKKVWGKKPIPTREGASIPITVLFKEVFNIDAILMGFGLASDAIHSPNESYGLFNYYSGIDTIIHFNKIFYELNK